VNLPNRLRNNGSGFQDVWEDWRENELLISVENSFNIPNILNCMKKRNTLKSHQLYISAGYKNLLSMNAALTESSRIHLTLYSAWITLCALKYLKGRTFFICRHEVMFCFVTVLDCHYSKLHFKLRTQITLAWIQFLQQHFQCHNQYYSRLTVTVCKHTAVLWTSIHVFLLLGVL